MDPDLVAQITKLVIEKLGASSNSKSQISSLSNEEIKRWNDISASLQFSKPSHVNLGKMNHTKALSDADIKRWNSITNRMKNENQLPTENTAEVKLYS